MNDLVRRVAAMVRGLLSIGTLHRSTDAAGLRTVQVALHAGETTDDIDHVEPYGFTARPPSGAEALVARVGADNARQVALVLFARTARPDGLEPGETMLYDDQGQAVALLRGSLAVIAKTGCTVDLGCGGALTPQDGVVTGQAICPYTGLSYFAMGACSAKVRAEK